MAKRIEIGKSVKGSLAQKEHWWYLIVEDSGEKFVEYEWSYVNPYPHGGAGSEGTKKVPVDEFLAGDYSDGIKARVRVELKRL